jgi:hypothetical protein
MEQNRDLPLNSQGRSAPLANEQRQEPRLQIAIPVKVFPDIKGVEGYSCCTYEISLLGARLASLPGITKAGQVIWIQRNNRRARYKVIWIGKPNTPHAGQVGVETLEPGNVIWESELKTRIMNSSV